MKRGGGGGGGRTQARGRLRAVYGTAVAEKGGGSAAAEFDIFSSLGAGRKKAIALSQYVIILYFLLAGVSRSRIQYLVKHAESLLLLATSGSGARGDGGQGSLDVAAAGGDGRGQNTCVL